MKTIKTEKAKSFLNRLMKDLKKYKTLYFLVIPVVIWYILFCYKPMYGVIIAFKDYRPGLGIAGSKWVGFKHFKQFFESYYFGRTLKNTLIMSLSQIIFGFPAPIIFALLLNEIKNMKFKRITQTISYMPHFISMVVVASMIRVLTSQNGVITSLLSVFGVEQVALLTKQEYFVPIYVISGIWQQLGWNAIIYIAALAGVDQELYEAAKIDGANRWKQTIHITLPSITGTIMIMLLLRLGSIMNVGFEKVILLYNEGIYETADVISSYVYRKGLQEFQYSFSSAVNLFNTVINFVLIMLFNKISKKLTEVSLW